MKKTVDTITSGGFMAALAVTLLLWIAVMVYGAKIPLIEAVGATSFKMYYGALTLGSIVSAYHAFGSKRYHRALAGLGLFLVLLQGVLLYGYRFSGKTAVGEGETISGYYSVQAGPWAKPPEAPVALVKTAKKGLARAAMITIQGQDREITGDGHFSWSGYTFTMTTQSMAPLFLLYDQNGTELEGGYVKIAFHEPSRQFFQFSILPHRFYVSLPGTEEETWAKADGVWKRSRVPQRLGDLYDNPENVHLTITRGKLKLLSRNIKPGEPVPFDGYTVRLEQGVPWVEFEVTKSPSLMAWYAGLACLAAGGAAGLVRRRTA